MLLVGHLGAVGDDPEVAEPRREARRGDPLDEPLVVHPVPDDVGHRDDRDAVLLGEARRSGTRAIVPSSFMISQMTAAGIRPAIRARSTEASVWPARLRTPPLRARSGKVCPGRRRSCGLVFGSTSVRTVAARSAAEIPVVVLPRASTETVKAVPKFEVFCSTIGGRSSSSQRSSVRETQMSPAPRGP